MQTAESLYGLYVKCEDKEHERYVEVKAALEKIYKSVETQAKTAEHKGVTAHFMVLPSGKIMSFCAADQKINLGMYDAKTKTLSRHCDFSDIRGISDVHVLALAERSSAIISQAEMPLFKNNPLNAVWTKEIERMRKEAVAMGKQPKQHKMSEREILVQNFPVSFKDAVSKAQAVLHQDKPQNTVTRVAEQVR